MTRGRRSPETAKKYDVGGGEMLTVKEIAEVVGTTPGTIRFRLSKGWEGESLVLPKGERRKGGKPRTQTSVTAYTLALKFGRRLPSVEEIRETYPMSETTAMYWRNSIRIALQRVYNPSRKQRRII